MNTNPWPQWIKDHYLVATNGDDGKMLDVIERAAALGLKPDEITEIVFNAPTRPGYAPAMFFERANGDLVIISQQGTQTQFARHHARDRRQRRP